MWGRGLDWELGQKSRGCVWFLWLDIKLLSISCSLVLGWIIYNSDCCTLDNITANQDITVNTHQNNGLHSLFCQLIGILVQTVHLPHSWLGEILWTSQSEAGVTAWQWVECVWQSICHCQTKQSSSTTQIIHKKYYQTTFSYL